jgi:hypothetical protein
VPIVRLKTKEQQELFDMFKLPTVDYTKGYQPKPRPELVGGSESYNEDLHAVNEIRRQYRRAIV